MVSRILRITKINLKNNSFVHFFAAVVVSVLIAAGFGITNLDFLSSAQRVEMLLSLTGAIILTPIFLPEQDENIRDLIRSKQFGYLQVCAVRLAYSVIFLVLLIGVFIIVMSMRDCNVTLVHFGAGFASAVFLGSVGFFVSGVSGNTVTGYMAAMIYYLANFGIKDKLGGFFLFSLYSGENSVNFMLIIYSSVIFLLTFLILFLKSKL